MSHPKRRPNGVTQQELAEAFDAEFTSAQPAKPNRTPTEQPPASEQDYRPRPAWLTQHEFAQALDTTMEKN